VAEAGRQRSSADSDEGSSVTTLDEAAVKRELQQVSVNTPPSSASSSSAASDQTAKIGGIKQELDRSTSTCGKVGLLVDTAYVQGVSKSSPLKLFGLFSLRLSLFA